jgi:hypothetical protein
MPLARATKGCHRGIMSWIWLVLIVLVVAFGLYRMYRHPRGVGHQRRDTGQMHRNVDRDRSQNQDPYAR